MATRYEEIADDLAARIAAGEFPARSTLPPYGTLASPLEYNASKATIEKALGLLEARGLVRAVKKSGLVVRAPGARRPIGNTIDRHPVRGYVFPSASSASEPWQAHGGQRVTRMEPPPHIADRLGLPEGTKTVRRRQVTSPAGEGPYQLSDDWVHPDLLQQIPQLGERDLGLSGIHDHIEQAGHGPLTWHRHTRARQPDSDEAQLLEIPRALWVLEMTYVAVSGQTGEPVAVTVRVVPADRAELVDTMQRARAARWPIPPMEPPSQPIAIG
ncbi:putative HTH-type transcriptional regulator [Streptomyces rubradiris]|uniref:HTH-type transcriptional regulator n=1 Tax=Streptomyces rubradiris TaxID=285531 RepID=A0ABQ3RAJ9_STRRR|nr:putative HTH-type transcriptional regulator [Streptomyces rubradiris]GHI52817.1 putative HTH-type transcriptional regulator [Streptomyces rubradiris]